MKVSDLLVVKPQTFGISSLGLTDGRPLLTALNELEEIDVTAGVRITIKMLGEMIATLPAETAEEVLGWEIDIDATEPAIPIDHSDRVFVRQTTENTQRITESQGKFLLATMIIVTLAFTFTICYVTLVDHKLPERFVTAMTISQAAITAAFWRYLGILRTNNSLLGVVLGDGKEKEGIVQGMINKLSTK